LSDQCPQPLLHEEKTLTYAGFKPGTFGFLVGNATNWTIEVVQWGSCQNFSFLAHNTGELAAPQFPSKNYLKPAVPATPRDERKFFSHQTCFLGIKSPKTWNFAIKNNFQVKPILSIFHMWKVKIKNPELLPDFWDFFSEKWQGFWATLQIFVVPPKFDQNNFFQKFKKNLVKKGLNQ
jgi:hypothetical protein